MIAHQWRRSVADLSSDDTPSMLGPASTRQVMHDVPTRPPWLEASPTDSRFEIRPCWVMPPRRERRTLKSQPRAEVPPLARRFRGIVKHGPSGLGPMLGAGWRGLGRRRERPNVAHIVLEDVAMISGA